MNDKTEYPGQWLTAPADSMDGNGGFIFVTGRTDIDKFRNNPRFSIRVNVKYTYHSSGFPDDKTARMLEDVTDRLVETFTKDPVAVLTGIYTGDGQRDWIFYTASIHIFGRKFNEALADLPTLPIAITAENDPDWEEYAEMRSILD